jgi:DnaK suppressor protein
MEVIQFENFKHIIEDLLRGQEDPLGRRDEIAVESTPDTLDQVQKAADRALAIRQLELDSNRLRGLRDALARIEDGTYGTCLRCDGEISLKRLKAVPWAAYCLACQEAADHEESEAAEREELAAGMIGTH